MNNRLSIIVAYNRTKRILLRKGPGKHWLFNMNLDNPYYSNHIINNNLNKLIKFIKLKNDCVTSMYIESFASQNGHTMVNKTIYNNLNNHEPKICFVKNYTGIMKLLTIGARLPIEFVNIGHNTKGQCVVPLIFYKDNGNLIGVNLTNS